MLKGFTSEYLLQNQFFEPLQQFHNVSWFLLFILTFVFSVQKICSHCQKFIGYLVTSLAWFWNLLEFEFLEEVTDSLGQSILFWLGYRIIEVDALCLARGLRPVDCLWLSLLRLTSELLSWTNLASLKIANSLRSARAITRVVLIRGIVTTSRNLS